MSEQYPPPPGQGDPNPPPAPPPSYPPAGQGGATPAGGGYPGGASYPPAPPAGGYGGYGGGYAQPAKINNWLIPAILATVLCCLPGGIVAIVYAAQVNGKLAAGDVAGAQASADKAKLWTFISVGVGVVVGLIYLAVVVLAAGSGSS